MLKDTDKIRAFEMLMASYSLNQKKTTKTQDGHEVQFEQDHPEHTSFRIVGLSDIKEPGKDFEVPQGFSDVSSPCFTADILPTTGLKLDKPYKYTVFRGPANQLDSEGNPIKNSMFEQLEKLNTLRKQNNGSLPDDEELRNITGLKRINVFCPFSWKTGSTNKAGKDVTTNWFYTFHREGESRPVEAAVESAVTRRYRDAVTISADNAHEEPGGATIPQGGGEQKNNKTEAA